MKRLILILLTILAAIPAKAFPPAPYHLLYGLVRDEYGNPLQGANVQIILETASGQKLQTTLDLAAEPGTNYRLSVPMDAGITSDLYKATALHPTVPFKIKVKIGNTIFLPIEMVADFSKLGLAGQRTLLNLTLGIDSDGDGLPDAWERALLQMLGGNKTLADINAGDDTDGDGLSNLDEYRAGTYAFDAEDGFTLDILGFQGLAPALEFTVIRGRAYTIEASNDLATWTPAHFTSPETPTPQSLYRATDVRLLRVLISGENPPSFYRLIVR